MASGVIHMSCSKTDAWAGHLYWTSEYDSNKSLYVVTVGVYTYKRDGVPTSSASASFAGLLIIGDDKYSFEYKQESPEGENDWKFESANYSSGECYIYAQINGPSGTKLASYELIGSDTVNLSSSESGLVYIDNGTKFDAYQCYIDNGSSWDLYAPYIDNGTGWDICD